MKKKLIPALVAIVLMVIVGAAYFIPQVVEKYSYSKEKEDLNSYYGITGENEVPIMLQNELLEDRAVLVDGALYLPYETVANYFVDRFYVNKEENVLLYTTATDVIKVVIGDESNAYYTGDVKTEFPSKIAFYEGDILYIGLDYVKLYDNLSYSLFESPYRVQINTEWGTITTATIKKDTQVRTLGGIKCSILKEVKKGEQVTLLEKDETWSKVKTEDALIGYVETKRLKDSTDQQQTAVTEVAELSFPSIKKDHPIALAWHQVMNTDANAYLSDAIAGAKGLNTISPTWFFLNDNEGNFSNIASADYVAQAHNSGLEVWGLAEDITNDVDLYSILSSSAKRQNLIQNLVTAAVNYDLDGINIDFEGVNAESGPHFIQFLRELSIQTRANGIVLSVDNYVPTQENGYYNRKEQGLVADYVIIMGYDEHWGGSDVAGSVASISFVESGIADTIAAGVPADKVVNAVPFYTRIWKTSGAEVTSWAVGMEDAETWVAENGVTAAWDETTCQNYGEVQKEDGLYQIWMEDEKSLETKLSIMKKYTIGGVAAWKLGYEKATVWDYISAYVQTQ